MAALTAFTTSTTKSSLSTRAKAGNPTFAPAFMSFCIMRFRASPNGASGRRRKRLARRCGRLVFDKFAPLKLVGCGGRFIAGKRSCQTSCRNGRIVDPLPRATASFQTFNGLLRGQPVHPHQDRRDRPGDKPHALDPCPNRPGDEVPAFHAQEALQFGFGVVLFRLHVGATLACPGLLGCGRHNLPTRSQKPPCAARRKAGGRPWPVCKGSCCAIAVVPVHVARLSATRIWSHQSDLNRRKPAYKTGALPLCHGGEITPEEAPARQGRPYRPTARPRAPTCSGRF